MKISLIIIGIWSAVLFSGSLAIVGALGPIFAGSFYPFTLPFIILAGISLVLSILGLREKRIRSVLFWVSAPLHGLLFLPFHYAIERWPGGDDGPGMAWMFFIGTGSGIAALIAIGVILAAVIALIRDSKKSGSSVWVQ